MTSEHDSLDGFNVEDLLAAIGTGLKEGNIIGKLAPFPRTVTEQGVSNFEAQNNEDFKDLAAFQYQYLDHYFVGRIKMGPREDALAFKQQFELDRQNWQQASVQSPQAKRIYEKVTLESLAEFAQNKFEEHSQQSGAATPFSKEQTDNQRHADYWTAIAGVVKAASELPDD